MLVRLWFCKVKNERRLRRVALLLLNASASPAPPCVPKQKSVFHANTIPEAMLLILSLLTNLSWCAKSSDSSSSQSSSHCFASSSSSSFSFHSVRSHSVYCACVPFKRYAFAARRNATNRSQTLQTHRPLRESAFPSASVPLTLRAPLLLPPPQRLLRPALLLLPSEVLSLLLLLPLCARSVSQSFC